MPAPSGATPILALPYPIPDDPVDVPRDVKALADKLDAYTSLRPPLVSALPGSPVDGQEAYYQADATNGIVWHLRYRAGSASAYKWELIGGTPLTEEVRTSEGTASTAYVNLATVGPQITVPLAGEYLITGAATITENNSTGLIAVKLGPVATSDNDRVGQGSDPASASSTGGLTIRRAVPTANSVLLLQYRAATGMANFALRNLAVIPVRVA